MEWTIIGLFVVACILFILSLSKQAKQAQAEEERIDMVHISVMEELKQVKDAIQKLELDNEIIMAEAGLKLTPQDKQFKREILDLYKRGYSIENIAEMKKQSVAEIEKLLAPFKNNKEERGTVAHED